MLEAQAAAAPDPEELAHRAIRLIDLSLQEYALGVGDNVILKPAEYAEALVFCGLAEKLSAALDLGPSVETSFKTALARMESLERLDRVAEALFPARESIVRRFGVPVIEVPYGVSAEVGMSLFRANCAACHRPGGRKMGDRFAPDLQLRDLLQDLTPLQMTTVITEGIPESPMAGWAGRLSPYQTWSIVYSLMEQAFGPPPSADGLRALPPPDPGKSYTDWLKTGYAGGLKGTEAEDFARKALLQPLATGEDFSRRLTLLASRLSDLSRDIEDSGTGSDLRDRLTSLYADFEMLEGPLLAKSISGGTLIEARFQSLLRKSEALHGQALQSEISSLSESLSDLAQSPPPSERSAFAHSFLILLREGLEALLLIGALLAVLKRLGASRKQVAVWIGAAAAILASFILFLGLHQIVAASGFRAASEGIVLIAGSLVLMYMVLWLSRNAQLARLRMDFRLKVAQSSSVVPIAIASFSVVFREGLETALFYQALFIYTGNAWVPVIAGAGLALALLVLLGYLILGLSVRLPLKWFFGVSGALLFVLAFSFLGKGIFGLQAAGLFPMTVLPAGPTIDWLGVYPVAQTLTAQAVLTFLAALIIVLPFVSRRPSSPYPSLPT
jgi:high-affinity iron transporter